MTIENNDSMRLCVADEGYPKEVMRTPRSPVQKGAGPEEQSL
jgi:hypothetical protein